MVGEARDRAARERDEDEVLGRPGLARLERLALLEKAERDCFVGASLTARPRYTWLVNGREVAAG